MTVTIKYGFEKTGRFRRPKEKLERQLPKFKKLWKHQTKFFHALKDEPYWSIYGPPAVGKSLVISALLTYKLQADTSLRAIIAVPQTVIGAGFENSRFHLPGLGNTFFDPDLKLHNKTKPGNTVQLKRFLKKTRTPVNERAAICTHQTLILAYQKYPELLKHVVVVIDECHHSKAEELAGETIANQLGRVVTGLVDQGQQVGFATATAARSDGYGLLGPHQDKFVISECPFDEYLAVCKCFKSFGFYFTLYDEDLAEPIDTLLGDKQKKTIIYIPHVMSSYSGGKHNDLRQVYRGIAGCRRPQIRNRNGAGDGITLVKRGRIWIRVVDLVNEENRPLKKQATVDAHNYDTSEQIDVIIALNMFKEGANWRWAEQSLIVGYRSSFLELAQMVGRVLRDAPDKQHADIYYVLRCGEDDIKGNTAEVLNDYLKALLLILLLEDTFKPAEIRIRVDGKQRLVKTDLLAEALNHDMTEKQHIVALVFQELLSDEQKYTNRKACSRAIVEILEAESVQHSEFPVEAIAKQILATHRRRRSSRLERNAGQPGMEEIDVALLSQSKHPLAYVLYYTRSIGIDTLVGLRKALRQCFKRQWWEVYSLITKYYKTYGKFPAKGTILSGVDAGSWITNQRWFYSQNKLSADRVEALNSLSGWEWNVNKTRLTKYQQALQNYIQHHGYPPETFIVWQSIPIGSWLNLKRSDRKYKRIGMEEEEWFLQLHPQIWRTGHYRRFQARLEKVKEFFHTNNRWPSQKGDSAERSMAAWVNNTRSKYKTGKLSARRIELMASWDSWVWSACTNRWRHRYNQVCVHVKQHKNIPSSSGSLAGSWCAKQRKRRRQRKLSQDRIDLLEQIPGWFWNAKDKPVSKTRYTSSKKTQARSDTIVKLYRQKFRRQKLPPTKQYWSMCAQCVDGGKLIKHAELHQMIQSQLIKPEQFHGVDYNDAVYEANCAWEQSNWYRGDFHDVISEALDEDPEFNPGIVNVDTVSEPKAGVELFSRVLYRLADVQDVVFVGNFILYNRGRHHEMEEIIRLLKKNPKFQYVSSSLKWDEEKLLYTYGGSTANRRTEMGTIILWR